MNIYLLIYFPLYFFDILNINRTALALTQLISKSMLILAIFLGYFFDRFAQQKKFIISISGIILFLSFFLFIVFRNVLFWYGVFLSISLATRTIIQTGMSKLMFEIVKSNEDLKKNIILISNASSSLGAFIPTILFSIIVLDFHSFSLWNSFFLIGWIISCPLLLAFFLIKDTNQKNMINKNEIELVSENQKEDLSSYSNIGLIILVYVSYFLFWGSYLFGYPLSSWITSKFGQNAFKFYSSFYVIFFLFNMCGFFVAKRTYRRGSEKKMIMIGIFSIVSLFLVYPYISFPTFFFLYSIEAFIYGIVISNFLYIIIDISRRGKYENLKYQIMQSSSYMGNAIFTSLGIFLANSYSTTSLMVISAVLVLLAAVPLILKEIPYFSAN
jgi:MFS family permease